MPGMWDGFGVAEGNLKLMRGFATDRDAKTYRAKVILKTSGDSLCGLYRHGRHIRLRAIDLAAGDSIILLFDLPKTLCRRADNRGGNVRFARFQITGAAEDEMDSRRRVHHGRGSNRSGCQIG